MAKKSYTTAGDPSPARASTNKQEGETQSYSQALGHNSRYTKSNNYEQEREDHTNGGGDNDSFSSTRKDIKDIFKDLNIKKFINVIKKTMHKIKNCSDSVSKISIIFEGIIEIFE